MKKRDGTEAESKDELLKEISYFKELLNNRSTIWQWPNNPAEVNLPINCSDFTLQELKAALSKLSLGKSPRVDQSVTPEALKYGGESMTKALLDVCNKVLNDLQLPAQWLDNIIIRMPKKGCRMTMQNYRRISLLSVAAKTYAVG